MVIREDTVGERFLGKDDRGLGKDGKDGGERKNVGRHGES